MKGLKKRREASQFVSLFLFITFSLFIYVSFARAEDIGAINPSQTFDSMLLLEGQSASSGTSSTQAASFHTIWVTSIGNSTLSATISGPSSGSGIAWVMILGTGGRNWGDIAFGPVPNSGIKALIEIGKDLSFAIVMGGIVLSSEVSAEAPASYSFNVAH